MIAARMLASSRKSHILTVKAQYLRRRFSLPIQNYGRQWEQDLAWAALLVRKTFL